MPPDKCSVHLFLAGAVFWSIRAMRDRIVLEEGEFECAFD
jgi:hypothetical protein